LTADVLFIYLFIMKIIHENTKKAIENNSSAHKNSMAYWTSAVRKLGSAKYAYPITSIDTL